MSVTLDEVKKIASLAYLQFTEPELQQYTDQLNQILGYVDKLNEIDTSDVPITYHPAEYDNVMREDEVLPGLTVDQALQNAPAKSWQYFVVPKVISKSE
jgi:aspartyl-tRNA(Asn)/glutamyl-tRNA(Gln) amidotransferase subunit C